MEKNRKTRIAKISQLVLKVSSRCNLNCSYCYVYNKVDHSWSEKPALMSNEIFQQTLRRAREHCELTGQRELRFGFHGGEPCLIGHRRFDEWCKKVRSELRGVNVHLNIQTNGTLIDENWIRVLAQNRVGVGISIDGPEKIHDAARVDFKNRGSYANVVRALDLLHKTGITVGVLCVIPVGADPLLVHRNFIELGCKQVTYLFPDYTHESLTSERLKHGSTPCADFLIPIFDEWFANDYNSIQIVDLLNIARVILGGESVIETIGNRPPGYVFIESDGEMEGLDALRNCKEGIARIGLNVRDSGFQKLVSINNLNIEAIFDGLPLPDDCYGCPESTTCAGGQLPHRYSEERLFNNPSVWCADLKKLFEHVRECLAVTVDQTYSFRQELSAVRRAAKNVA